MKENFVFNTIPEAVEDLRQGKIIIVVDDEDRENEGDFIMLAEKATPEAVNFMAKHGRGLICVPMTPERLQDLDINFMVRDNTALLGTAFTVSVDYRYGGVSTGISAAAAAWPASCSAPCTPFSRCTSSSAAFSTASPASSSACSRPTMSPPSTPSSPKGGSGPENYHLNLCLKSITLHQTRGGNDSWL